MPRLALWFLAPFIAGAWALAAGAALAQYLDEPSPVPGGLNEPCQLELQAQRDSIESERLRLDPLVGAFEAECGNVATDDADAMASCQEREAALGGEVDAYFARLGDYEKRTAGAPERQRLDKAIAAKRAELAKAEALIPKLKEEIEKANSRGEELTAAMEAWAEMSTEARNKAVEESVMFFAGWAIEHAEARNVAATEATRTRLETLIEDYRKSGLPIPPRWQREMLAEKEDIVRQLVSNLDEKEMIEDLKFMHTMAEAENANVDLHTRERIANGILGVAGVLAGVANVPGVKQAIDVGKLIGAYGEWAWLSVNASDTVGMLSDTQSFNLDMINKLAARYIDAVSKRKTLKAEIPALEGQRAAVAYGCAGTV